MRTEGEAIVLIVTFAFMVLFFLCLVRFAAVAEQSYRDMRARELLRTSGHRTPRTKEAIKEVMLVRTFHKVENDNDASQAIDDDKTIESMEAGEEKLNSEDECAICLSAFVEGDTLAQGHECSHMFHLDCISVWIAVHDHCPVCRTKYNLEAPSSKQ